MRLLPLPRGRTGTSDTEPWIDGDEDRSTARQLTSYADQSLAPEPEPLARIGASVRAAFVESATRRAAGQPAGAGVQGVAAGVKRSLSWRRRRVLAAVCAVAILTLSSFGFAAAESGPGQPFYRLKLNIEAVYLPPPSTLDRLYADVSRGDARLEDIARSAAASDWSGAADAASAYLDVVNGMELPADKIEAAGVASRLSGQLTRLEALRTTSRPPETAALDKAIAAVCEALGIPVPALPPTTAAKPGARATSTPGGSGSDKHDPVPTGSHRDSPGRPSGSRDADDSSSPSSDPDAGRGGPDGSGRSGGPGWPGGSRMSPTPKPTGSKGGLPDRGGSRWAGRSGSGAHSNVKAGALADAGPHNH